MAYVKYRIRRKTTSGYDIVHPESNASVIYRYTDSAVGTETVEESLAALEAAIGSAEGDLSGKMALVSSPTNGNLLSVNSSGQAVDSGKKAADFAAASHTHAIADVTNLQTTLDAKAPLASPALTGTPTAPTAASTTNSTQIATTAFVQTAVNALMDAKDALRFVGTLTPSGTSTKFPAANAGEVYRITADGTISGVTVHEGDTATCCVDNTVAGTPANWFITHTNHDGQVMGPTSAVDSHVAIFDGSTGTLIKDSGYTIASSVPSDAVFTDTVYTHPNSGATAGSYGPSANATLVYDGTFTVPYVTVNAQGHVTAIVTKTMTMPASYSHPTSSANGSYGPSSNVSPAHGGTFSVPYVTVNTLGHVTAAATKTITLPSVVDISWATSQPSTQATGDIWMESIS